MCYLLLHISWSSVVCEVFLLFSFLFTILIKKYFKFIIIFSTFTLLFAFPTVLFLLQLVFNIYKPSLSTSVYYAFLFFLFLIIFINVFVFVALFPSWHLALVLISSLCFS